jgi:hypothetical protein
MRFTYTTETINGQPATSLKETVGFFSGYTTEQVAAIAESLYPNYQTNNMSNVFSDVYFNYCLRRLLDGQDIPNTYTPKNLKLLNLNQFSNLDE